MLLLLRKKRESAEDKDDWDYGVACYESALRAYRSLERDGHSGIQNYVPFIGGVGPVTRAILMEHILKFRRFKEDKKNNAEN